MKHLLLTTIAAVLLVGTGYAGPIHTSASKGDLAGVQAQLDIGVDVNAKGSLGESPLHKAAKMGRKDMVQLLIDKGADLNAKEDEGLTPLDWAIKRGRTATADLLRKHGGKYSTIHTPAMIGDIETVKELLADGANVNAKDEFGKTPLDRAIKYQRTEIADLLRKHGGKTVDWLRAEESIHMAAIFGYIEAVKQHIAGGTDLNAKGRGGHTPLHYAAQGGHREVVELLIANGADVNATIKRGGRNGWTPVDFAADKNQTETIDLLRKHGGKTGKALKALMPRLVQHGRFAFSFVVSRRCFI